MTPVGRERRMIKQKKKKEEEQKCWTGNLATRKKYVDLM